jgi:hypothetical protein
MKKTYYIAGTVLKSYKKKSCKEAMSIPLAQKYMTTPSHVLTKVWYRHFNKK